MVSVGNKEEKCRYRKNTTTRPSLTRILRSVGAERQAYQLKGGNL